MVEIVVEITVKAVVKTGCHTTLYNGPLQCQSGGPRYTILFAIYYGSVGWLKLGSSSSSPWTNGLGLDLDRATRRAAPTASITPRSKPTAGPTCQLHGGKQ